MRRVGKSRPVTSSPFLRLWPLEGAWVLVAVLATAPLTDALDGATALGAGLAWLAAGAGWTAALVAMLVPRSVGLTVVRLLVPAALLALGAAAAVGDDRGALDALALLAAAVATLVVLSPWTIDAFVDGSSYGPERRLALRTPLPVLLVAVATWAATAAGATAGPQLLASERWLPGVVALAVGAPVAALGVRALHQLSRRWLVLVPTGMVLHDQLTMPEPQLFLRQTMARLGPALVDAPGADETPDIAEAVEDLTAGASGLVIELELTEPVELLVRDGRGTTLRPVTRVRFSPGRPAELLAEARRRRLPVG